MAVALWCQRNNVTNTREFFQTADGDDWRIYLHLSGVATHDKDGNVLSASNILSHIRFQEHRRGYHMQPEIITLLQYLHQEGMLNGTEGSLETEDGVNLNSDNVSSEEVFTNAENEELNSFLNEFCVKEV